MTLDEEMKLWEDRANDEFGQILKQIQVATMDLLYSWNEMSIEYNALSEYVTRYSLDGNRKYTAKCVYTILKNYDILDNYTNVKKLVNKLMKIANK